MEIAKKIAKRIGIILAIIISILILGRLGNFEYEEEYAEQILTPKPSKQVQFHYFKK